MIHVRAQASEKFLDANKEQLVDCVLHISFVGFPEISTLKKVLDGFLNTRAEFNKDYFTLADKIEEFLKKEETFTR